VVTIGSANEYKATFIRTKVQTIK